MRFCKTISTNQKTTYTLQEVQDIYHSSLSNHNIFLYEWIDSNQVYKPYVDVDVWYVEKYFEDQIIETTNRYIKKSCDTLNALFDEKLNFAIETSSGRDNKIDKKTQTEYHTKISIHIVILNFKIQGLYFKKMLEENGLLENQGGLFDPKVYNMNNQKFRVAGFRKENSPRKSRIIQGEMADFLVSYLTDKQELYEGHITPNVIIPIKTNPQSPTSPLIQSKPQEYDECNKLLDVIGSVDFYDDWFKITMILYALNPALESLWDEWSQKSSGYDYDNNKKIWDKMKKYNYSIKSLHYIAKVKNLDKYTELYLFDDCINIIKSQAQKKVAEFFLKITDGKIMITDMNKGDCFIFNETLKIWVEQRLSAYILYISNTIESYVKVAMCKICEDVKKMNDIDIDNPKYVEALKLKKSAGELLSQLSKAPYMNAVVSFIKSDNNNYKEDFRFLLTKNKHLLSVKNGVVDLRTGILRERQYDDYLTTILDIEYNPSADTTDWTEFVYGLFENNIIKDTNEVVLYIQKLFGYMTTKETKQQIMVLANGGGSNGKSLISDCLNEVLKQQSINVDEALFDNKVMKQSANTASPALAGLFNKSLGIVAEMDEKTEISNVFKKLVDSSTITARELNKGLFKFELTTKFLVHTNYIPKFKCDEAILRRLIPITFYNKYTNNPDIMKNEKQIDYNLADNLLKNKEGILKWLINGAKMYYDEPNLKNPPADLEKAKNDVIAENDWTASIEITGDNKDRMSNKDIYTHINLLDIHITQKTISKTLINMGVAQYRTSMERGFKGIKSKLLGDIEEIEFDEENAF
jgi:P4 family phage/plasmid primase-like protien